MKDKKDSGAQWVVIIVALIGILFYILHFSQPSQWERQGRRDFDTKEYNRKYPQVEDKETR